MLTPVYKRWTRERSPPELYNHGFENMESLGAVYSRVSSHIFGDWNACGEITRETERNGKKENARRRGVGERGGGDFSSIVL